MRCVQLGYHETKGLRHLLWIRLCRATDIHIIRVVVMPCLRPLMIRGLEMGFLAHC